MEKVRSNLLSIDLVLIFNDYSGCNGDYFLIGYAADYTSDAGNCAGWPNQISSHWPEYLRIWTR